MFINIYLFSLDTDVIEIDTGLYFIPRFFDRANLIFRKIDGEFTLSRYNNETQDIINEGNFKNNVMEACFVINGCLFFYDYQKKIIYEVDIDSMKIKRRKKIELRWPLYIASNDFIASYNILNDTVNEYIEYLDIADGKINIKRIYFKNIPNGKYFEPHLFEGGKYILRGSTLTKIWILIRQETYYEIGEYDPTSELYVKRYSLPYMAGITSSQRFYSRIIITERKLLVFEEERISVYSGDGNADYTIPFYSGKYVQIEDYDIVYDRILVETYPEIYPNTPTQILIINNVNDL